MFKIKYWNIRNYFQRTVIIIVSIILVASIYVLEKIWIIQHTEAPYVTSFMKDSGVFNWTSNYRLDSDIPHPYGYFMEYNPPLQQVNRNDAEGKTKKVAWFVSNFSLNGNCTIYANQLAKHISVDIYGGCGVLKCPRDEQNTCLMMLEKDYKFYLSYENSHCNYYITEKLFLNALSHNVLLIVMGPRRSDYELVVHKRSFNHVDDFESPKQLAKYLKKLDEDDDLYNEYFDWMSTGTVIIDEKRQYKHYEDINKWWSGPGVCVR